MTAWARTNRTAQVVGSKLVLALLATIGSLLGGCASSSTSAGDSSATSTTFATGTVHRYVIPLGTSAKIDAGEAVEVMPSTLEIDVGDAVEIINEDDHDHNVGPFFVRAGETVSQVFPSVAEFTDVCSVSSDGSFTIKVT